MDNWPGRFFEAQLKGETPPAFATMQVLYDLASEILARQPWSLLADQDLVLVEEVLAGETCFCSVMGALGEVFSLHVYLGSDGYRQFDRVRSGRPMTVGEFFSLGRCLFVEFVKLRELDPLDRALLKAMGHVPKRGGRAPMFRSIRPGYYPWYVTDEEARVLAECARAILAFLEVWARNPEHNFWEKQDVYPVLVPQSGQGGEHDYQVHMVHMPVPPSPKVEPPLLDETRMRQVRGSGFPSQGIWEVDRFYGAGMIGAKDQRKACFRVALAIDAESGLAYPPVTVSPDSSDGEALTGVVLQAIDNAHALPVEIHVRSSDLKVLLDPVAGALGFRVKVKKSLPALDFAKSELLKMMGDPGPFSAWGAESRE